MKMRHVLVAVLVPWTVVAQNTSPPPDTLPASATGALAASLDAAHTHATHVWRDTAPLNGDGTVNAYIEIAQGDRRKWEFDMRANARAIDRMMPDGLEYPIAYGFVPQTVSYDGDPFDALVLGPAIAGGQLVRGVIVGLMLMEDEKGLDSKVVLALVDRNGRPMQELSADDRTRIGDYFIRYKAHEPGKFSRVPGWGSSAQGLAYITTTHEFFLKCRQGTARPCRVAN